jgi:hypothetical protein
MKQTKAQQIAIDATMALIDYYKKHFEDARRNAAERFSDSKSIIDSMRNSEGAIECEYRWNVVSPVIDRWEEPSTRGRPLGASIAWSPTGVLMSRTSTA